MLFDAQDLLAPANRIDPPALTSMPKWARVLIGRANAITPQPGFTASDIMMAWERCEGRCAVSGLPFSNAVIGNGRAQRPFAPSLDRIDPTQGYTPENTRLVCVAVNFAMNAWGEKVLLHVAKAVVAKVEAQAVDRGDHEWLSRQDEKIRAAEYEALQLSGEARRKQVQKIAALKRARTLGPAGLKRAAAAALSRRKAS